MSTQFTPQFYQFLGSLVHSKVTEKKKSHSHLHLDILSVWSLHLSLTLIWFFKPPVKKTPKQQNIFYAIFNNLLNVCNVNICLLIYYLCHLVNKITGNTRVNFFFFFSLHLNVFIMSQQTFTAITVHSSRIRLLTDTAAKQLISFITVPATGSAHMMLIRDLLEAAPL